MMRSNAGTTSSTEDFRIDATEPRAVSMSWLRWKAPMALTPSMRRVFEPIEASLTIWI